MQLGIMDTIVRAEGLERSLQAAATLRADGVEVYYRQADSLLQSGHAARLRQLAGDNGLTIPSLCLGMLTKQPSLIGPAKTIGQAKVLISHALDVAAEAGSRVILVPCIGKNAIETEEELSKAADALAGLVEQAEEANVVLGIESTLNSSQQSFLLNCLGGSPSAGIYFDTGEALSRKMDVATGIRDLGPNAIAQVHFKDVRLVEGQPPNFQVLLGQGDVDFPAAVRALRAVGFSGWIILETPPVTEAMQDAAANLAFAREVLNAA